MTLRRVLPSFDGQQIVGSFTGQGGFIGQQRGLTLNHFPRLFLFACTVEGRSNEHKKTAPEGAVLVS
ncbi:hypothetical protein D3C87_811780 [compost metagenome]